MGCEYSRQLESKEELEIQAAENKFKLFQIDIKSVVEAFDSVSTAPYLSTPEFTRLKRGLNLLKLTAAQHHLLKQFERQGGYDRRALKLLAVLCCQGTAQAKAQVLFGLYAETAGLKYAQAWLLASDMLSLAVNSTPDLAKPTQQLQVYLQRLNAQCPHSLSNLVALFTNNREITSKSDFLSVFETREGSKLLSCKDLRAFILPQCEAQSS